MFQPPGYVVYVPVAAQHGVPLPQALPQQTFVQPLQPTPVQSHHQPNRPKRAKKHRDRKAETYSGPRTIAASDNTPALAASFRPLERRIPNRHSDPFDSTTVTSTVDDRTLRSTATIRSLEEFLQDNDTPAANNRHSATMQLIEQLRNEATDRAVRAKILRLPDQTCEAMVSCLENNQMMLLQQCTAERGKIVAPLVEKLDPDTTFTLIRFALDNFLSLAKSQSGCIALPRILAHVKPTQLQVFFEAVLDQLDELFPHQYGNFVVKHFISAEKRSFLDALAARIVAMNKIVVWATNKFGSHLIESIFATAQGGSVLNLIESIFADEQSLKVLAHDRYANYCIQSAFDCLDRLQETELKARCAAVASVAARDSQFAPNIMKHAHQDVQARRSSQKGKAPGPSRDEAQLPPQPQQPLQPTLFGRTGSQASSPSISLGSTQVSVLPGLGPSVPYFAPPLALTSTARTVSSDEQSATAPVPIAVSHSMVMPLPEAHIPAPSYSKPQDVSSLADHAPCSSAAEAVVSATVAQLTALLERSDSPDEASGLHSE